MSAVKGQIVDEAVEDSLEFYIKFPKAMPTDNQPQEVSSSDNNFVFVFNEKNAPIILLLGWAGCQDKYLQKYSKIYEERGLISIRYTAPISKLFWNRSDLISIADKILKLIYDMNFENNPFIVHVFSNGGAYLYHNIVLAMKKSQQPVNIRGMIFDSAPGDRRVLGLFRALRVILGKDKPCGPLKSAFVSLILIFLWMIEDAVRGIRRLFNPNLEQLTSNPLKSLMNEESDYPQLFLYSKEDEIIPYHDIEAFATHREKLGVPVSRVCFENSEHVKHYIRHPRDYVMTVCNFVNYCLTSAYDGCSKILNKCD